MLAGYNANIEGVAYSKNFTQNSKQKYNGDGSNRTMNRAEKQVSAKAEAYKVRQNFGAFFTQTKDHACDFANSAVSCPSCFKGQSARTSFEKNNSACRQENFMFSSYSLWIQERDKNASYSEALKNKIIPVTLSLAEIISHSIRTGNKTSLANRESQVPWVNHTSTKCFSVLRWLISLEADIGKPEKVTHSEAFRAATRRLCVTERVWTITGSLRYSIVIGSNPLKS